MDRSAEPWSDEETDILARMFNEGATDAAIAKRLGRSVVGIKSRRHKVGLSRADAQGWSPNHLAILAQMLDEGATDLQIARKVDRSERAVAQKRHVLGWLRKESRRRTKVNPKGLERRYQALREYLEIIIPLAKSKGAYEVAELAAEGLAKAADHDVVSPDAFPRTGRSGLAVAG